VTLVVGLEKDEVEFFYNLDRNFVSSGNESDFCEIRSRSFQSHAYLTWRRFLPSFAVVAFLET
jgi:hypothetical protein